jgi:hypothetical protein
VDDVRYLLTVKDDIGERLAQTIGPVATERVGSDTQMTVEVADQAELLGLMDRLTDFGIELIAITPAAPLPAASEFGS